MWLLTRRVTHTQTPSISDCSKLTLFVNYSGGYRNRFDLQLAASAVIVERKLNYALAEKCWKTGRNFIPVSSRLIPHAHLSNGNTFLEICTSVVCDRLRADAASSLVDQKH